MRSLEPYDSLICSRCTCCSKCCPTKTDTIEEENSQANPAFQDLAEDPTEDSFDQTVEDSKKKTVDRFDGPRFDITDTQSRKWSTHDL